MFITHQTKSLFLWTHVALILTPFLHFKIQQHPQKICLHSTLGMLQTGTELLSERQLTEETA